MIDGGLVTGYLAAAAARYGKRLADATVDAALDRLAGVVAGRLGSGPSADLERDPSDPRTRDRVARAVEDVARQDARFAADLAAVQAQLDRAGARPLINQARVWASTRRPSAMAACTSVTTTRAIGPMTTTPATSWSSVEARGGSWPSSVFSWR